MVVGEIAAQKSLEMAFTKDNSVIQTLPADATNDALGIGILPRAPRCDGTFVHFQIANALTKMFSINSISIAQQILRWRLPWEHFNELLRSPLARRMLRHIEVNDPAPIVGQDNQHEQHSQSRPRVR